MQPRLYYSPGACSLAVHIVLEEIGSPYLLELVSVAEGGTQSTGFLAVNPKGRVPVLGIGDTLLTEAPAILLYLSLSNPHAHLVPDNAEALARSLEWLNWLSGTVHAVAFAQLWRPQRFVVDTACFDLVTTKGKTNVTEAFSFIRIEASKQPWAVGEQYSWVDPFLLVFYRWGNRIGLNMRAQFPAWTAHAEVVCARSAVEAALSQEGITVWQP